MAVHQLSKGRAQKAVSRYLATRSREPAPRAVKGPPTLTPSIQSLAIARRNQHSSRLLRLPPELRNHIYELAMDTQTPALHTTDLSWERLNLSRTCRQIFAETAARYHAMKLLPITNLVHRMCHVHLNLHVVELLAPSQRRAIRAFEVDWNLVTVVLGTRCKFRNLAGLRRVVVKGGPKRVTRSVRAKVRGFGEWVGKEGFVVDFEAART